MLQLILHLALAPWRSHQALILENVALRHQLQVLNRGGKRPRIRDRDRLLWILLQRVWTDCRRLYIDVGAVLFIKLHFGRPHAHVGHFRWRLL